jgi:hypothetical protein
MTEIKQFELEKHYRICDNKTGSHITVRPDSDGLDLIEINDSFIPSLRLIITKDQARLLMEALDLMVKG